MNGIALRTAPSGREAGLRWLADHRDTVRAAVAERGALLIRGLDIREAEAFAAAAVVVADELMTEVEPFAPRTTYPNGVRSAALWPADQPICMHHELSYALRPPALQMFGCLTAPASGGAVALADGAALLRDLPADLVSRADRHGWQLIRNHNGVVGMPWPEAFGMDSPAAVQRYCRENGVDFAWDAEGGLRTCRTRPAIRRHPVTGERVWFNALAFLSEWTMAPMVREYLLCEFGAEGLPFTTRFGDGSPLDSATVDLINDGYAAHAVRVPFHTGDLLLVDNLRMAHSRESYTGPREVVVALADPDRRPGAGPNAQQGTDQPPRRH